MKIPFKFQEIDNLDHATYLNKFKAALKKLKPKANTPETAVTLFINQEFEFAGGVTEALIIAGNANGPWKKWIKDSIKANKKMTIVGKGYVATDEAGNDVLKFARLQGNAKLDKVQKAAKALLRKAKMTLAEVDSLTDKVVSQEDQDFMANLATDSDKPEDQTDDKAAKLEEAKAMIQDIAALQLDIKNHLGQVREVAASGDMSALLAKIGMIYALQDKMQEQIDALRALGIANSRADKFAENLAKIKEVTEKNFSKKKEEIQAIEEDMSEMIGNINSMIAEFGANAGYKIQL
jgi:hypothetical protein